VLKRGPWPPGAPLSLAPAGEGPAASLRREIARRGGAARGPSRRTGSTAGGRALLPGQGLPLARSSVRIRPVQEPDQHQGLLPAGRALLQVAEDPRADWQAEDGLPGLLGVRAGCAGHGFHLPYGETPPGVVLEPGAPVGRRWCCAPCSLGPQPGDHQPPGVHPLPRRAADPPGVPLAQRRPEASFH
jgi:hypothetical protein